MHASLLLALLARRGPVDAESERRIADASAEELKSWFESVIRSDIPPCFPSWIGEHATRPGLTFAEQWFAARAFPSR